MRKRQYEKILDKVEHKISKVKSARCKKEKWIKEYSDTVWPLSLAFLLTLVLVFTSIPEPLSVSSDSSYLSTDAQVQIYVIIDKSVVLDNVTQ